MSAIPQSIYANQKASLDKILAAQGSIFGGFEKLVDLNLKVWKATFDDVARVSQQAIELKDPQDAVAFTSNAMQPNADKAVAYSKHVYDIFTSVQADLTKLTEEQVNESQQQLHDAIEEFAKSAPTGSESAIALMKSSVVSATNAYETATKAAKQASDAAQSNITAATNASLKAATEAAEAGKKATSRARSAS
ncbi:TIGR01841 family phasin [Pusillimonas sp. DMV24BSW_D]|uniref:TIGR01841 family phasin n=1 Tax=Neopusillimonas aestuarii TaxID=2716226 RepID=UPI00140C287E|nr:TIGR01841 family phasin [Pusillimonas sp. DMV24BSW_D]QIM48946.1 TIGR01841 family phasin [Pusillimonas sp. DMV24BSW_D]